MQEDKTEHAARQITALEDPKKSKNETVILIYELKFRNESQHCRA